jgi:hypothetical protein
MSVKVMCKDPEKVFKFIKLLLICAKIRGWHFFRKINDKL